MRTFVIEARLRRRTELATGLALAAALLLTPQGASARHSDTGYGLQGGGLNPNLALGNVFSGIYGLAYTYDRANYDFDCQPTPALAVVDPAVLTVRSCRALNRPRPFWQGRPQPY